MKGCSHAAQVFRRASAGEDLPAGLTAHAAGCQTCQAALSRARRFGAELHTGAAALATPALPDLSRGFAAPQSRVSSTGLVRLIGTVATAFLAVAVILAGYQMVTTPVGSLPAPSPAGSATSSLRAPGSPAPTASAPGPLPEGKPFFDELRGLWQTHGLECSEYEITVEEVPPGDVLSCTGQILAAEATAVATAGLDGTLRTIHLTALRTDGIVSTDAQAAVLAIFAATPMTAADERQLLEWSREALTDPACQGTDCVLSLATEQPRVALQTGANGAFIINIDFVTEKTEPSPDCQPVAPTQLPDGSPAGRSRQVMGEVVVMWEWGEGDNAVRQAINHPSFSGTELPHPDLFDTEVRGEPAAIVMVGDSTLSHITITWVEGVCTYTIWIGPGVDFDEASEYALRY